MEGMLGKTEQLIIQGIPPHLSDTDGITFRAAGQWASIFIQSNRGVSTAKAVWWCWLIESVIERQSNSACVSLTGGQAEEKKMSWNQGKPDLAGNHQKKCLVTWGKCSGRRAASDWFATKMSMLIGCYVLPLALSHSVSLTLKGLLYC